jgi:hypothetical protein
MSKPARYINTDLDVAADRDLGPLVAALRARGVDAINEFRDEDGRYRAGFEVGSFPDPDSTIEALLAAIESLDGAARELWAACSVRVLDLGYDCGTDGRLSQSISHATLARAVASGMSFAITLYGLAAPRE